MAYDRRVMINWYSSQQIGKELWKKAREAKREMLKRRKKLYPLITQVSQTMLWDAPDYTLKDNYEVLPRNTV